MAGLTPEQRAVVLLREVHELEYEALEREITDKAGRDEMLEAARQLSQERAGLVAPPENLAARPPGERALRVLSSVGDELERELAKVIGPDKAHALRATNDGWPSRAKMAGCSRGGDGAGGDAEQTETVGAPPR